jgi:hypothetical protein
MIATACCVARYGGVLLSIAGVLFGNLFGFS